MGIYCLFGRKPPGFGWNLLSFGGGRGIFLPFPKPLGLFFGYLLYFWRFLPRGFHIAVFPFLGDLQSTPSYFWAIVFAWVRVRSLIIRFGFWLSPPYQTWVYIAVHPWEALPSSRPYQTQLSMGSPMAAGLKTVLSRPACQTWLSSIDSSQILRVSTPASMPVVARTVRIGSI